MWPNFYSMQSTQEQDHCIKTKYKRIRQGTSRLVLLTLDKMSMLAQSTKHLPYSK